MTNTAITKNKNMSEAWDFLVNTTKHCSRYFFHAMQVITSGDKIKTPGDVLELLRLLVDFDKKDDRIMLKTTLNTDANLFRARIYDGTWNPSVESELLAPPPEEVSAGRMNPAGISYLYLAAEKETALIEVRPKPPCTMTVAQFKPLKDLTLLNLCDPPNPDGIADEDHQAALHFFRYFIDSITLPVIKDGREHIDYVPSQIVCEYFAHAHLLGGVPQLHGLQYPSTIRDGGKNIVLFR